MIKTQQLFLPILIGLVILPRLSVDLYLPSLMSIGHSLPASDQAVQMTLTAFMLGYVCSMLIIGPLSDVWGNKKVIIVSLILFLLSTFFSILTHSIVLLIIERFFQALGGCSGTLIGRVMVKEYYPQDKQVQILAYLSSVMTVSPLFLPVVGGVLQHYFGWQAIFIFLEIIGLIILITCATQLRSSKPRQHRISFKRLIQNYYHLLTNRLFLAYSFSVGCAWANYFSYMIASPFLFQKILGYSSIIYGILMAIPITGYLIGVNLIKRFTLQFKHEKLIFIAACISMLGALLLMVFIMLLPLTWWIVVCPMTLVMMSAGMIIPCAQNAISQPFSHIAGTATGLFFFIQMLFASISGLILQLFKLPSVITLAGIILSMSIFLLISFTCLAFLPQRTLISSD